MNFPKLLKYYLILLFYGFALLSHPTRAQTYSFQTFNVQQGLAQSQVYAICQDKFGNLWFGTLGGGLCRYDGINFETYTLRDGLIDNTIYDLYPDTAGGVWIGTLQGITHYIPPDQLNLSKIKSVSRTKPTFINYSKENGLAAPQISSLYLDKGNNLWVGTYNGVSKLPAETLLTNEAPDFPKEKRTELFKNFTVKQELLDSLVLSVNEDNLGNLYFATLYGVNIMKHLIRKVDKDMPKKFVLYFDKIKKEDGIISNRISNIVKDKIGNIWLVSQLGFTRIDPETSRKLGHYVFHNFSIDKETFRGERITSLIQDKRGNYWVATSGAGLFRVEMDESSGKVKVLENITKQNGLPADDILSLFEDREGNLWIGTDGGGVTRFRGKMFESFSKEDGLSDNTVFSITQTKDGKFWIGSYTGGVNRYDPTAEPTKRFSVFPFPKTFDMASVQDITEDSEGNVWFAGDMGAVQYNPVFGSGDKAYRLFTTPDTIAVYKSTNKIIEDKQKNIWVSCMYRGLQKLTPDPASPLGYKRKFFTYREGMIKAPVRDFIIDHNGDIWSATSKGLSHVIFKSDTAKPEIHKITKENGLPCEYILALFEDRKNNIWLGTKEGAIKIVRNPDELKPGENSKYVFRKFSTTEGMSSDLIYLINEDTEGNLWFGTNKGVDQYLVDRGTFRSYGKAEGFTGIETNHKATCGDKDGNLWFGTIKGIIKYNPREVIMNSAEPLTSINRLRVFFKDTEIPADHVFRYDQNYLTFDFVAISLTVPEKVTYQWKLQGFDNDWLPVTNETRVTYSNIPHGEYVFMLRAANNDGLWNEKPVTFSFVITPPFWKTWWFYTSCIIFLSVCVYGYIKWREKKLIKEKLMLEAKVTERTNELSEANKLLSEKNRKITQSINYARRLQKAILPPLEFVQEHFPESFILFKPRDIVSGDFYWMDVKGNSILFAAADCTGHGVPGAMMSIVGYNLLNQSVSGNGDSVSTPSGILHHLNTGLSKIFREEFEESDMRDGMDIALCCFDRAQMKLKYSGAYNPLYLVRNNELVVKIANKFPIGKYLGKKKQYYTDHELDVIKGDTIYLFSDGYMDQFGGPDNRKFMRTRFQKMILEIQKLSMEEQKEYLDQTLEEWKGERKQLDDILVMGIRV